MCIPVSRRRPHARTHARTAVRENGKHPGTTALESSESKQETSKKNLAQPAVHKSGSRTYVAQLRELGQETIAVIVEVFAATDLSSGLVVVHVLISVQPQANTP